MISLSVASGARSNLVPTSALYVLVFIAIFYLTPKFELPSDLQILGFTGCCIIVAVIAVMLSRSRAATFEIPVGVGAFIISIYCARIIYDLGKPALQWVNVNVEATYGLAVLSTALFSLSFFIGYLAARPKLKGVVGRLRVNEQEILAARRGSWLLFAIGLCAIAATLVIAGGPLAFISTRGSATAIESVAAIQYTMMLGVVAAVLRISLSFLPGNPGSSTDLRFGLLMAFPVVAITLAEGSRRYALPLLVGLCISWFIIRRGSIPVLKVALVAVLGVVLVLLPLESVREGGSDSGGSFASAVVRFGGDPAGAFEGLFSSQSTSMLPAFAMAIQDAESAGIDEGLGRYTLAETILQPIPQQIWPGKPESLRNELIEYRYGLSSSGCTSLCPTYGPVSTFYADYGLLGATIGGLLIGLFAAWWTKVCFRRGLFGVLAYAGTYWGFLYMWWSSVSALTIMVLFFGIPLLILAKLTKSSLDKDVPTAIT
ncbi:hypothetical protein CH251_10445 [Rhodococcus sp. 06-462-5]|uniref:O-antigen polysaccharide polymerase Wzy n=1 Tax=unclassified Rhodococcus (in: high G+C Gram-positive bacteria) TaxID=192944 RepID=UPI000B9B279B|nr:MULTISPECIES: O-antigen polysaccharide polymerase Wzy [unclassified Rhodococcus (in: high G+C Gram-positive bacteria)]OZC75187.1 hypothetical protein CH251_10445 [Rhodococcus sp. 06-462-5]OZE67704.1 hypothetical protein CH270_08040 [Rhodococcus sp. 02-925g]